MNDKNKKYKRKKRLSVDLSDIQENKKNKNQSVKDVNKYRTGSIPKDEEIHASWRRRTTKVSHKNKEYNFTNIILEDEPDCKGKKVKFNKIEVINVESWKKINLKLTSEENIDELIKISEGKKGRIKNVSCTCAIF